jgi:hypothetical protein
LPKNGSPAAVGSEEVVEGRGLTMMRPKMAERMKEWECIIR